MFSLKYKKFEQDPLIIIISWHKMLFFAYLKIIPDHGIESQAAEDCFITVHRGFSIFRQGLV